ncbi:MAG TPA: di-heme-cytochrome C peroxidase [Candidatus Saccharimonadales bacterium]|nr:di-heme-cytochrome C peroxidase [Candidatus Saccharimonadales bacterium]
MKKVAIFICVAVIIGAFAGAKWWHDNLEIQLPTYAPTGTVVWLNQNWTPQQRDWFYHADQGTQTFGIPYEWFIALEQPALALRNPGLLSDPAYLDRYGFISTPNSVHTELPIGFAHGSLLKNPDGTPTLNLQTKVPLTSLGLTCAACHTGRLSYQNTTILIDGGPALTNLALFQKGLAESLMFTKYLPFRFARFARRVLGPGASEDAKAALRKQLEAVVSQIGTIRNAESKNQTQTVSEGYGRLDALNRIGNIVFSVDLDEPANYVAYSAPVHFPRIWQASWFEWVQYNGSIEQPMVRNVGEALGVGAKVSLSGDGNQLFDTSAHVQTIFKLEQALAGTSPPSALTGFQGLSSPKWRDSSLPPINERLAAEGAVLYKDRCEKCHMAPISEAAFWTNPRWSPPNAAGERYLNLAQIPVRYVGTDPAQAEDMSKRQVKLPASLGIAATDFGTALGIVAEKTVNHWYDQQQPPITADAREEMNGRRPNGVRAPLEYKVRPLNGIWATPPYLHNGSVPNLYALLSPVDERPKKFYLGSREYDPANVGYRTESFPGGFEFDTSIRGNRNTGHEFSNEKQKPGVIGAALSPDERRALIEYLKTL